MASADNEKEEVLVKVPPLLYPEEDTSSIDSVDLSSMDLTNKNSIDNDQENKTENLSSNNNIIDSIPSEIKIHEDKYIYGMMMTLNHIICMMIKVSSQITR